MMNCFPAVPHPDRQIPWSEYRLERLTIKRSLPLIFLLVSLGTSADDLKQFQKEQAAEQTRFQTVQQEELKHHQNKLKGLSHTEFEQWRKQREKDFTDFRLQIEKEWGRFTAPSKKQWVEYSADRQSVAAVDFEKGVLQVEVLKLPQENTNIVSQKVARAVIKALSSRGSDQNVPLEDTKQSQILHEPLLSGQLPEFSAREADSATIADQAARLLQTALPETVGAGRYQSLVFQFPLVPNHIQIRMKKFLPLVQQYCLHYGIDAAHVLATIHAESFFNPLAFSSAGAVGLMQLVPDKGGREACRFVYGKDMIPSSRILYDPAQNIQLGCAYIYLLANQYFSGIKNKTKNLYCTIAGYNTGPANVGRTFTAQNDPDNAVKIINEMDSSEEVFSFLLRHLPHRETRKYLKSVTDKMDLYQ